MSRNKISTTYTTSNEAGEEEITIEYEQHRNFFQWLFRRPKLKNITETYIGSCTSWCRKGSGHSASATKVFEILDIIEYHRQCIIYEKLDK